jgi:hypothetical protein
MRLSRQLHHLLAIACIVVLAGCITIEENYTFKKDGSGTLEYVIDLSSFADLMKSMKEMSDDKGKGDESIGDMDMKDEMQRIKGIEGISKVKVKEEQDGFVQRLSFRFADVNALNKALNVLMPDSSGQEKAFFAWEGSTLVRTTNRFAKEMGSDIASDGDDTTDVSGILKMMQYKYSFAFAEEIAEVGIAEGVVREDPSAREVKLSTDWSVIMNDPRALDLRIAVKK